MKLKSDDLRHDHVDGLAEHARFGLDAADAPADDAESVDHRRVRVGADERVGIRDASLPKAPIASRMAARSTTHGTPVKSCRSTRLGVNAISREGSALASHLASAAMSSALTTRPSSVRSKFSSRMRSEKGNLSVLVPALSTAWSL